MPNFADIIDLPTIWGIIILFAISMYVLLDGFSLGLGILFPLAPTADCRNTMVNSIAPFWDGNETWLVLGGGGLFAAFPLAYSIIMPALYKPIIIMLISLVFRGVAFEFRFKADISTRKYWDLAFHLGSLNAALMQGIMLGNLIQGITVIDNKFAGHTFDWLSTFSITTGISIVFGYSLLGSTWLYMKSSEQTQQWIAKLIPYLLFYVLIFIAILSLWMPLIDISIYSRWFSNYSILYLSIIPMIIFYAAWNMYHSIQKKQSDNKPFVLSIVIMAMSMLGIIINTWPYIVPHSLTFSQAAASPHSQSFMLIAVVIVVPVILLYTGYSYYVFRGKVKVQDMYAE